MAVAKAKKAAETVQDDLSPEVQSIRTAPVTRETVGPEDPAELLGCQDEEAQEDANPQAPADLPPDAPLEYAVAGCDALNLRKSPGLDSPVIAVLPRGAGVSDTGRVQNDWWEVVTGRLTGWVLAEYLEPVWS